MQSFLYDIAELISKKYITKLPETCIIFPNKRAALFFRKYLARIIGKPIWSPNIFTLQSWIQKLTKLMLADKLTLLFELYDSFQFVNKSITSDELKNSPTDFDSFYFLGEILLRDFNEMDSYEVDVNQLFTNIQNLEEIDYSFSYFTKEQTEVLQSFWQSFSEEKMSEEKRRLIELWKKMPAIYNHFSASLFDKNIAYNGLMYRKLSKLIDKGDLPVFRYSKYIFIGFNALNKIETKLFRYLKNKEMAEFYFDMDAYYVSDEKQEAGLFMRRNIDSLNFRFDEYPLPANFVSPDKHIDLIAVPRHIGQAKLISTILNRLISENKISGDMEKTAIILPDEHALFPVLHSLPAEIEKINVTMGYPFKSSSLCSLIKRYLKIQKQTGKSRQIVSFYYRDIIAVLRHPEVWFNNPDEASSIIKNIEQSNSIYVDAAILNLDKNSLYKLIFTKVADSNLLFDNLLEILYMLFTFKEAGEYDEVKNVENEYIYQVYIQVKRLKDIIEGRGGEVGLNTVIGLLSRLLDDLRIPFSGEPLEGIQVMGLLESRNIDFENIIMLDTNEGVIPPTGRSPSFVPEKLRVGFQMPTMKQNDAMFAYYFYRLLQRSSNIFLLYNNVSSGSSSSELSRYFQQLIFESGLEITQKQQKQYIKPVLNKRIVIEKTSDVVRKLDNYDSCKRANCKRLSASAINMYLDCRMKFYFRHIARLKEVDKVDEFIEPNLFGSILHYVIEMIYNEYIETRETHIVEPQVFNELAQLTEAKIDEAFSEYFKYQPFRNKTFTGNQLIIKEVIKKHIYSILKIDKNIAPFEIVSLEEGKTYNGILDIKTGGGTKSIGLKGIIDRVDKVNGVIRIVDYKSGHADKKFKDISSLFNRELNKRNSAIMQVFFYLMLYKQECCDNSLQLLPGIYNIREMSSKDFDPRLQVKQGRDYITINEGNLEPFFSTYNDYLYETLSELFDPDIAFDQTENTDKCKFCDYNGICARN